MTPSFVTMLVVAATASALSAAQKTAVLTGNANSQRTGVYEETSLTPALVSGKGMVRWFKHALDGEIEAHPLYVPDVAVEGRPRTDLVIVQTTNNKLYAFDPSVGGDDSGRPERCEATSHSKARVWCLSLYDPGAGRPIANPNAFATPVIDPKRNWAYVVYGTTNKIPPAANCVCLVGPCAPCPDDKRVCVHGFDTEFWLAAIDITTGTYVKGLDKNPVRIEASSGNLTFHAYDHRTRPGLLLDDGTVYVAFGMRGLEETHDYHGWVMWYDAATLAFQDSFCTTPRVMNLCGVTPGQGAGIWQSGGGLAAGHDGAVYFVTSNGNGEKDAYGDSVVRIGPKVMGRSKRDVASFDAVAHDHRHKTDWLTNDIDLGSGGPVIVSSANSEKQFVVVGGKTGILYVLNPQDAMKLVDEYELFTSQWNPNCRYAAWQGGPHLHGPSIFWQFADGLGYLFHWAENDHLKRITIDLRSGKLDKNENALIHSRQEAARPFKPGEICKNSDSVMPGGMLALSADHGKNAIVWAMLPKRKENKAEPTDSLLIAFDARELQGPRTLRELWRSKVDLPYGKFVPPVIANGHVLVVGRGDDWSTPRLPGTIESYRLTPPGERSPQWHAVRPPPRPRRSGVGELRVLAAMASAADSAKRIAPPPGAVLLFTVELHGRQRYRAAEHDGKLAWIPGETSGSLIADSTHRHPEGGVTVVGTVRGAHWTWHDGSRMTVAESASVNMGDGSVPPWQLLKATAHRGRGMLATVAYLQRFDTAVKTPESPPLKRGAEITQPFVAAFAVYAAKSQD